MPLHQWTICANKNCLCHNQGNTAQYSSNNYIEAYESLFTGMEIDGKDAGLGCNCLNYGKGYTLVVFDLSSEVTDAASQTVKKRREFTARKKVCFSITRGYKCDTLC